MAMSLLARARTRIPLRVGAGVVPATGAAILLGGVLGVVPASDALVAGVGLVAAGATAVLVRTALRIHHAEHAFGACRGAGFIGMGAMLTGLTVAVPIAPIARAPLAGVGVLAAPVAYVLGILLLPGAATSVSVRLRRGFDGLGFGISLGFAVWLLAPVGDTPAVALVSALTTVAGISAITVSVLRTTVYRQAALRCGLGAVTVLTGLCGVTTALAYGHAGRGLPAIGVLIVAGLALTVDGGSRTRPTPAHAQPQVVNPHLSGYPLLALPAAVGVVAAVYHLVTVGEFDRTAIVLGLCMVSVLTVRELLAVNDIRRYARRLTSQEAHYRSLVTGATDLTLVLDDWLTVRWQSPAAARLFGLADSEVIGRPFLDMLHPEDASDVHTVLNALTATVGEQAAGPPALVNARLRDGHGLWRDTESTISDQRGVPEVRALVVHVRDVGERRHLERTLLRLSYTDQLTGLSNRRALMRALIAQRREPGQRGTLLVIDLHGLAQINDVRGREVGDAVLIEVSRRIRGMLGEHDTSARLGGDEFAVLTTHGAVLAYALATRLVTALREPYQLPGVTAELHTSVGLAELTGATDSDEVLRHADLARNRARQLGRDRVEWYDMDVEAQLARRMGLEQEVIGAVDSGELDLVFQPVLSLPDGCPVGVEALLRWRHPQLGTIMPAELLPIAEAVGVSRQIGDWVVAAACRRLALWSDTDRELWMSVNVAPRELLDAGFAERIAAALTSYGLAPERLVVEVAETWIAEDVPAVVAALAGLRQLGVRAALDDFGAGQASLSHLRRLPVDMLKLDHALVNTSEGHQVGPAVIEVVVSLGRRLGLEIVAKGLESADQIDRARGAGCRYGQGFGLCHPAPAERMEAYLDSHRAGST